ncbi:MAG: AMMECR1 domain-containing protein, partial [Stackebrandtia sp.]
MASFSDAVPSLASEAVRTTLTGVHTDAPALLDAVTSDPDTTTKLLTPGACFVTLRRDDRLRGCIGTLVARRSLYTDIVGNARRAMTDPRLPPVDSTEWEQLHVDVSLLSAPTTMDITDFD